MSSGRRLYPSAEANLACTPVAIHVRIVHAAFSCGICRAHLDPEHCAAVACIKSVAGTKSAGEITAAANKSPACGDKLLYGSLRHEKLL